MVNEPRTNGMVKEPRDGERIQQSASDERGELVRYLVRAFNSNKELRQRLGDLFHGLDAEGIEPGDIDAWVWARDERPETIKPLLGKMPRAEQALIISERIHPLLDDYPLLNDMGGWCIIRDSYRTWHGMYRFANLPLSADLRAVFRNGETEWFWEGVVGKLAREGVKGQPARRKRREKPTLLVADLWQKLGLTDDPDREKLLAAHRREWPVLEEPTIVERGTDYGDFEKGGMMPRIAFTINVNIPSDPRHYSYADVMSALDEFLDAARQEARRQYKAILEKAKAQGLKERPLNYKPWQSALWLYLVEVKGSSRGQIKEYEKVDRAQASRAVRRAAELLNVDQLGNLC
jgi:hypothetical protein